MEPVATQPFTQPVLTLDISSNGYHDAEDIICLLHPTTPSAYTIVENVLRSSPQHVLLPNTPEGEDMDDVYLEMIENGVKGAAGSPLPEQEQSQQPQPSNFPDTVRADQLQDLTRGRSTKPLDLVLRMSSKVHNVTMGFVFGRESSKSDIVIKVGTGDMRISAMHFRIFVKDDGVLMLQDHSTNGTFVDNHLLLSKQATNSCRTLNEGSEIRFIVAGEKQTRRVDHARFIVRLPERRDINEYQNRLRAYIETIQAKRHADRNGIREPVVLPSFDDRLLTAPTTRCNYGMRWSGAPTYRIVGNIGKGAFASVYKLSTVSEGVAFAAKEIDKRRFVKDGILDQKFSNELEIMKKLSHPNIVKLCDFHDAEGHLYIIMEYVPHGDLSQFIGFSTKLEEKGAKSVARDMCQALTYIHMAGVVHRDIKPENILISKLKPLSVKLSDFGLSKMIESDQNTFLKTFCGTLLYCAPEVYPGYDRLRKDQRRHRRGQESHVSSPYSSAVDIWSLGAVLYQLLCGKPPVEATGEQNGARMLEAIMRDNIEYQDLEFLGVSKDCIELLTQMLCTDGLKRITAADSLAHPWLDGGLLNNLQTALWEQVNNTGDSFGEENARGAEPRSRPFSPTLKPALDTANANVRTQANDSFDTDASTQTRRIREKVRFDSESELDVGGQAGFLFDSSSSSSGGDSFIPKQQWHSPGLKIQSNIPSPQPGQLFGEIVPQAFSPRAHKQRRQEDAPSHEKRHKIGSIATILGGNSGRAQMSSRESLHSQTPRSNIRQDGKTSLPIHNSKTSKRVLEFRSSPDDRESATKRSMLQKPNARRRSLQFPHLGSLTPVEGSISNEVLQIEDPVFTWGRFDGSTHVYPDWQDTRIPKCGIDIVLYSPSIYDGTGKVSDMDSLANSNAMIMTRSSQGIKVNGVKLTKRLDSQQFRCGKLRTGDVIEIFSDGLHSFLRYRCEFFVGESAQGRGVSDPFSVEASEELLAIAKEQSALNTAP